MDITGADFDRVLHMLHDRLNAHVPIQLPIGVESSFRGIVDLIRMKAEVYYDDDGNDVREEEIPADILADAEQARNELVEALAELDEDLMEKYCAGEAEHG